jgi:hypothetical protein
VFIVLVVVLGLAVLEPEDTKDAEDRKDNVGIARRAVGRDMMRRP